MFTVVQLLQVIRCSHGWNMYKTQTLPMVLIIKLVYAISGSVSGSQMLLKLDQI